MLENFLSFCFLVFSLFLLIWFDLCMLSFLIEMFSNKEKLFSTLSSEWEKSVGVGVYLSWKKVWDHVERFREQVESNRGSVDCTCRFSSFCPRCDVFKILKIWFIYIFKFIKKLFLWGLKKLCGFFNFLFMFFGSCHRVGEIEDFMSFVSFLFYFFCDGKFYVKKVYEESLVVYIIRKFFKFIYLVFMVLRGFYKYLFEFFMLFMVDLGEILEEGAKERCYVVFVRPKWENTDNIRKYKDSERLKPFLILLVKNFWFVLSRASFYVSLLWRFEFVSFIDFLLSFAFPLVVEVFKGFFIIVRFFFRKVFAFIFFVLYVVIYFFIFLNFFVFVDYACPSIKDLFLFLKEEVFFEGLSFLKVFNLKIFFRSIYFRKFFCLGFYYGLFFRFLAVFVIIIILFIILIIFLIVCFLKRVFSFLWEKRMEFCYWFFIVVTMETLNVGGWLRVGLVFLRKVIKFFLDSYINRKTWVFYLLLIFLLICFFCFNISFWFGCFEFFFLGNF